MRNEFNPFKLSSLLSFCGRHSHYALGSSIHALIFKLSHQPNIALLLSNSLISMYSKCASLSEAIQVFDQCPVSRDTVTWNSIIAGHLMNRQLGMAFEYFKRMCGSSCKCDHATLTTVVSICTKPELRYACDMMHCFVISNGFEQIVPVGNALVSAYFKCGCPSSAHKVFDGMTERNVITWTAMVSGMAQSELFENSLVLFREMRNDEAANSVTYSSSLLACSGLRAIQEGQQIHGLVVKSGYESELCVESALMDVYSKCGAIEDACLVFCSCKEPDEISLTVMLVGFAQSGLEENALELFAEIVGKGIQIDASMVSAVLGAFGTWAPLSLGKQIHSLAIKKCLAQNVFVSNGLINMYSKSGELKDSVEIFEAMVHRNTVSWNSMIAAFARHGQGSEALQLYSKMESEGIKPTDVTYISLLHACSHVGSVEKGIEFLDSMSSTHGFAPRMEHCSCVVDMLGRAGLLKEARSFIEGLSLKPKTHFWQALLGACGVHGDLEMGKYAAKSLVDEEPDCPSAYVLLGNMYSAEGKWKERARIAKKMKEMGVKKDAGVSWIEVGKKIHCFVVEDKGHCENESIYQVLGELISTMREEEECVLDERCVFYGCLKL